MLPSLRTISNGRRKSRQLSPCLIKRCLLTLAIESSCDDTSVAILEKPNVVGSNTRPSVRIHFHEKVTANSLAFRGIHPLVALGSHEENLAHLVQTAIAHLPRSASGTLEKEERATGHNDGGHTFTIPDFVTVTRGPGMGASLNTGLNTAKGLSVAWQIPLLGVHHMQAHALTPRLVSALSTTPEVPLAPAFPFLSLLVSGGHTMLIHSKSLCDHPTLASTGDMAIGIAIDKIARDILPEHVFSSSQTTMYGPLLEKFAFPGGASDYAYTPTTTRKEEVEGRETRWGWRFSNPLARATGANAMQYSFSGVCAAAKRLVEEATHEVSEDERRDIAREAMRVSFEHLANRVVLAVKNMAECDKEEAMAGENIKTLVVSGGVAANNFLRHVLHLRPPQSADQYITRLRSFLDARGYSDVQLVFPPLHLCTDNAAMIGWTGIEMFEAGWASDLSCQSLRKWSLDPHADDGGILGVPGWRRLESV